MMGGVEDRVTEAIWQWCQDTSDIKGWDWEPQMIYCSCMMLLIQTRYTV